MSFKPLRDLITVKLDPSDQAPVSSLLYIPDSAVPKATTGTVVAVGPGKLDKRGNITPVHVAVGDRVIVGKGSGRDIKVGNEQLLVIHEDDIMAVLN